MSSNEHPAQQPAPGQLTRGRLVTGIGIWVTGQLSPLGIPLIPALGFPNSVNAALAAFVFFGLPGICTFAAIVVLGRDGFNFLRSRAFALFKRCYAPGRPVGLVRHKVGLVLFLIPLLIAWLTPYLAPLLPLVGDHQIKIAICGDAFLLVSLLVLGGDFWEKLRRLFVYDPGPDQDGDADP